MKCSACGFENPARFRFCGGCGAALAEHSAPPARSPVEPAQAKAAYPAAAPERRQVTALFCDLVGSTPLSGRVDPEDFRDMLLAYREACAEAIARYGGTIVQYAGDGLLASFGYPQAHEDNAVRAVRASLDILARMAEVNGRRRAARQEPLDVRMAAHTGMVVVGEMVAGGSRENVALVGEPTNLAARLQGVAPVNAAVVSGATARLVAGFFECRSLGRHALKGIQGEVEAVQVLAATGARTRLEAAGRPAARMLGRDDELGLLSHRWREASGGQGQAVLLTGEAGIGKSRLLHELNAGIGSAPHAALTAYCSAYHTTSAFHPLAELMQDLPPGVAGLDAEDAATIAALVGGEASLPPALADQPPARVRQRAIDALVGWIAALARTRPVLFAVEDVHWADDSTLAFLGALMERAVGARVLVVMTARPEFRPPWPPRARVTQLSLQRLSPGEARTMLHSVLGEVAVPPALADTIVERTDGVPLFVEELARMVAETGAARAPEERGRFEVPATLRDSLMARLDRLGPDKPLAQLCSAVGRTFGFDLLSEVAQVPQDALAAALDRLVAAEFLERDGDPPLAAYSFRHALIQEAAHESLVKRERQGLHRRIAEVLEARALAGDAGRRELLAHHYAEAGMSAAAVDAWEEAGHAARRRSASVEAAAHFQQALAELARLDPGPDRDRRELALQVSLGAQLIATRGNAAPEVERAYGRAQELCDRAADLALQFRALRGMQSFYIVRGRVRLAREIGERLLKLAERAGERDLLLQAHRPLGLCLLYQGELSASAEQLRRALALYDADLHRAHRFEYGSDPAVLARSHLAWVEWLAGRTAVGVAEGAAAIDFARRIDHAHSLAFALSLGASLHQFRGDVPQARRLAGELLALSREHDFPYWASWADCVLGWCRAADGEPAGLVGLDRGLDAYRATGAELMRPYFLTLRAQACAAAGRAGEGLAALSEARALCADSGSGFWAAEIERLTAELAAMAGRPENEVAEALARGEATARRQGARSLLFRLAIARCRLLAPDRAAGWSELRAQVAAAQDWAEARDLAAARAALAPA